MATKKGNFLAQFRDKNTQKLRNFTATQFAEVWGHYDADENGYIEGKELDKFFRELMDTVVEGDEGISEAMMAALKKEFMDTFDENADNRIDISELAQILPTDENFLLLFRRDNPLESSIEFMQIWKRFDKDRSGYIEADELKAFLTSLLREKGRPENFVTEEKIIEYTSTLLQLFDQNRDGKLQLSEMARLLPVKENYLCRPIFKNASKITTNDIERVFRLYDRDGNGTIEDVELQGFLKDFLELVQEDYDERDLSFFKKVILSEWDVNHDGKINREELSMLLLQQCKLAKKQD